MRPQVIFYCPQHFNRSGSATNPYFDPLIQVCEKQGVPYLLLEEPDTATDRPRNPKAKSAGVLLLFVLVCRKLLPVRLWGSFAARDRFIGSLANLLTGGRLRAGVYVTISNSMVELFPGLNPGARIYELQHGIIYSTHAGYFNPDQTLQGRIKHPHVHFLLYGEGFRQCFFQGQGNREALGGRVLIIGDVLHASRLQPADLPQPQLRRSVIVSLQFTHDWDAEKLLRLKQVLEKFLAGFSRSPYAGQFRILLKHHPRFNNSADLSDIGEKYPFAEYTSQSVSELAHVCCWHVTLHSTTAFEFASLGVPTCFWADPGFPDAAEIFLKEYGYPCQPATFDDALRMVVEQPGRYADVCRQVTEWHRRFYAPFDEGVAEAILKA